MKLISINQAASMGIEQLRKPQWSENDYIKIDIVDGKAGPWLHLYSPLNQHIHGRDPVNIMGITAGDYDDACLMPAAAIGGGQ